MDELCIPPPRQKTIINESKVEVGSGDRGIREAEEGRGKGREEGGAE